MIESLKDHFLIKKSRALLRAWDGPLTRELVLDPSRFGLGKVPRRLIPDRVASSVCGYCSTGCSLNIHLKDNTAVNLTPNANYPVNLGQACPKGWEALTPLKSSDRAATPYVRKKGSLIPVDWDTALKTFVRHFQDIQASHGPESTAFLSTGQICTEEMALLGALAKFGMGMIHGDGNTRQCMATSVVAYKEAFGFDAPPYSYKDFEESDVLIFIGANPCVAHPILWERVCKNKNNPQILVIDPRKTETAMQAHRHYALRPKSDLVLFYGLARLLIDKHWIREDYIREHTNGFSEFSRFVEPYTPEYTASRTGLTEDQLTGLASLIHGGKKVSFWWTMGVNQGHEAVRTAQAIINLSLMTGNIGRPGTGPNSITGQTNAMGSRLFSNTTGLLGGHDFTRAEHREKIARLLGIDSKLIPSQNSWAYHEILEGIDSGAIKGLWIIATNPGHSWIHRGEFEARLKKLDYLVVQDMYRNTATSRQADLILPAAGWGEKEGTVINSERRIGRYRKVSRAPGEALADFYIFKLIAKYWGCAEMFEEWRDPPAVFQLLKKITKGMPCDISGIKDYRMLEDAGGIQWPFREGAGKSPAGERHLFEEGKFYHPDQKARFVFEAPRDLKENTSREFPFFLLTGRGGSSQWHTQTRTGKSSVLQKLSTAEPYVEIHPDDAAELGLSPGDTVEVQSKRGNMLAEARLTSTVQKGQLFIPMHYENVNRLTCADFDPYSKQPSYKACAVRLRAV